MPSPTTIIFIAALFAVSYALHEHGLHHNGRQTASSSSSVQNSSSCRNFTLEHFPRDLFTNERRRHGWIAIHVLVALYVFGSLVLVIQAYLAAAIKTLCDDFHITSDSARNTVEVMGTSLPEFFCSLISVFVGKGDLGAGTVIGSCGVNSLFTLGLIGMLVSGPVKLSWYPLWRDNVFYFFAVTILLWISYDRSVRWQECMFIISLYLVYLLFINFNQKVERGVRRIVLMYRTGDDEEEIDMQQAKDSPPATRRSGSRFSRSSSRTNMLESTIQEEDITLRNDSEDVLVDDSDLEGSIEIDTSKADRVSLCTEDGYVSGGDAVSPDVGYLSEKGAISERGYNSERSYPTHVNESYFTSDGNSGWASEGDALVSSPRSYGSLRTSRYAKQVSRVYEHIRFRKIVGSFYVTLDLDNYVHGPESPFAVPKSWFMKLPWFFSIPAVCLFHITIPDCRRPTLRQWYWLTMLTSVVWVAVLSYVLVWMSVVIGFTFRIPSSMMGFVFLAFGLSIAEMVATYLATKAGQGYKAVYSIYGSNVFNITINLGFVWLLKTFENNPYHFAGGTLLYVNLCQLIIALTPLLLQFTRWRLNKVLAVVFVCLYGLFLAMIIVFEYNIFVKLNPDICW